MTLAKEPAYKVKDLAERIGNDAVYEAVFSDLFEGRLTGKTYMLDYDENIQDFGGNFIICGDSPAPSFDDYLRDHPKKNHNEPSTRYGLFVEFLSTIPARNNELLDGLETFMAIENPTREDYLNCKKAHDEYWATVVNIVPVLKLWTREMFRTAFKAYGDIPGVGLETPYTDIAKISWDMVGQRFKNYLTGTVTAEGVHMGGLYLSESGLNEWLERHGQKWPLGLKPTARVPDPRKRKPMANRLLLEAARTARNEIKNKPGAVRNENKINVSMVVARLKIAHREVYNRFLNKDGTDTTMKTRLRGVDARAEWDLD